MATVQTYAIIENGSVVNTVLWNGDTTIWQPPSGSSANLLPAGSPVSIGWTTSDGVNYVAPTTSSGS